MATTKASIELTATDRTRGAFASAERSLHGLVSSAGRLNGLLAGLGGGLAVGGLVSMVKTSIDAADAISKLSVKTGIAVENLAGWQHVADLSGLATEQFEMAVGKLNTVIVKTPEKLRAVGVTATDAHGALLQLSDVFARVEDPTRRAALAAELFGERVGRDMTVALSQGRGAIEDLIRQGQDLNPVTAELAKNAEQFNDALRTLSKRADAAAVSLAGPLVKSVNQIIERFLAGEKAGRGFAESLFNAVFSGGNKLSDRARKLNKDLEEALSVLSQREANAAANRSRLGPLGQQVIDARLQSARQRVADLRAELKQINAEANALLKQAPSTTGPKIGNDAVDKVFDRATGGKGAAKARKLDDLSQMPEVLIAKQRNEVLADLNRQAVEDAAREFALFDGPAFEAESRALEQFKADLEGLISGTTLAKTEAFQRNVEVLNRAFFDGHIGAAQYEEAMAKLTESTDELTEKAKDANDIARDLGLTFSSAFEDAIVSGKSFNEILRGIYQDVLRLTVRKTVTEPLAAGFSGLLSNFKLPGFAVGTDYVPRDMVAVVHQGERIVPAAENRRGGWGGVSVNMTVVTQDAGSFRKSAGQIQADLAFAVQGARRFA